MRSLSSVPLLLTVLALACRDGPVQPSPQPQFSQAPPRIVLTDLGTLGGDWSEAVAVNARGHVIGFSSTVPDARGGWHGFFWDGEVMRDLGSFWPVALSDADEVVGFSTTGTGCAQRWVVRDLIPVCHAVLWDGTAMHDLGTLGGDQSEAVDINARGQVIGVSTTVPGDLGSRHAFLWDGGMMQDLGSFAPVAINSAGQVAGNSATAYGEGHALLWDHGAVQDLGFLAGGTLTRAVVLSQAGSVAGFANVGAGSSDWHAFVWDHRTMHDLGTMGYAASTATAINARGQVAGYAWHAVVPEDYAFVWDGKIMHDLGTRGGGQSLALAINERGQVAGYAGTCYQPQHPDGIGCHAFLWDGTAMLDLGALGTSDWSAAVALNANGHIVGWSVPVENDADGFFERRHAVLWTVLP